MEQQKLGDALTAACRVMRNGSSTSESELRQALENGDWVISFSDVDQWGDDVCVEPGEPVVIFDTTIMGPCKRYEKVGGWH